MAEVEKLEIFHIRHAEPQAGTNEDRPVCDARLSPLGEQQAVLLGERFKNIHFDAVFCSPLVRCVQTAAGAISQMEEKHTIELIPEIIERNTPIGYHGQSVEYLTRFYDKIRLCPDHIWGPADRQFDSITKQSALERARAVHLYLRERMGFGKRILVCSHAMFGNNFLQAGVSLLEEERAQFILTLYHSSVTKYKYTSDGTERISFSNDISHLRPLLPDYECIV